MESDLIICACHTVEHQLIFSHNPEDHQVYASVHLPDQGFWARVKHGLKYIFGYKCRYGAFEEFVFTDEHIPALRRTVETLQAPPHQQAA